MHPVQLGRSAGFAVPLRVRSSHAANAGVPRAADVPDRGARRNNHCSLLSGKGSGKTAARRGRLAWTPAPHRLTPWRFTSICAYTSLARSSSVLPHDLVIGGARGVLAVPHEVVKVCAREATAVRRAEIKKPIQAILRQVRVFMLSSLGATRPPSSIREKWSFRISVLAPQSNLLHSPASVGNCQGPFLTFLEAQQPGASDRRIKRRYR